MLEKSHILRMTLRLATLALAVPYSLAFPTLMDEASSNLEKRIVNPVPGFSAADQLVDVSGPYAFVEPVFPRDKRGPCPGLNALANHGYLPHNGVGTIAQFIEATTSVFRMGYDLASFLSIYAAVMDGDLTSWSIGGPPDTSALSAVGLLAAPQGISGSHNKYEGDVSPGRGDLYEYGNDYKLVMSQFEQLYNMQANAAAPNYNIDVIEAFRNSRWNQSLHNNKYFFFGPFTGFAVNAAANSFIYRFMANKSAEHPEGILNKEVLKSFFAVQGPDNNLTHTPGHERIPENWYTRSRDDAYGLAAVAQDGVPALVKYPHFASVGGNVGGKTNNFAGVDVTDLSGGVYNSADLLQGNNFICFALQFAVLGEPDVLKGLYSDVTKPLQMLKAALTNSTSSLNCPQAGTFDTTSLQQFAGYTKSL